MDTKSILNIENYKKNIDDPIDEIFNQYLKIMDKYNETIITSIHVNKHDYFKYVYLKGIESLTYIFNMLIIYTKNLSLTYHHSEKSLFYYIEFIGQIGDDNHSFLQLSSKDAILFVYKKTIFDINDYCRKSINNNIEDIKIIDKIILYTEIYKNCINLYINTNKINRYDEIELRNNLYCDIFKSIKKLFNNINKSKNINYLEYLKKIVSSLLSKQYDFNNENLSYLLILVIKNIDKKKVILNILTNINSTEFDENYENISYIKTSLTN